MKKEIETLKVTHDENGCDGELLALGSYAQVVNRHIVWMDHFQCQKCFKIIKEESDPYQEVFGNVFMMGL